MATETENPISSPGGTSIPRKAGVAPSPSDPRLAVSTPISSAPERAGTPGTQVGLPEGVTVPLSVDHSLLQGKLLDTLKKLPVQLINDSLIEYDDAVKVKGDSIRNHGAYLYGVIKRYISVQERASRGESNAMGQDLTPAVQERLQKLVDDGFCTQEEMNDKVRSKIRMLSEKDALFAIEELATVERSQIRNFGSYFMGILNRYMRGEKGPTKGGSLKRYNDRYGSREDRRNDRRGRSPDRDYRRHRGDSPPRGDPYQRDRYGGRDNREYEPYRRERSRDRYGDDRGRSDYRRSSDRHDDSFRSSRYDDPRQRPPPAGQQSYGGYNQTTTTAIPPPPPPRGATQPPQLAGLLGSYNPQQQPQQQQPSYMQQQPNQPQPITNQQVFQQQQQFVPQTVSQPAGAPGVYLSSSAPSAPPAGTYVASQGSLVPQTSIVQQPNMTNQNLHQQQPPQSGTNYSGSFTSPAAPPPGNWQPQGQPPPADLQNILGLADKAASAVQALASQNALRTPAAPIPAPLAASSSMPMQNQQSSSNYYMSQNITPAPAPSPGGGRAPYGRTASMNELPVMVQFAVRNLQATGHLDGSLDEGILGMVRDLPEPVALRSLEKFSSCDTSTMRNKTAYLAGILRRELEKLNKR